MLVPCRSACRHHHHHAAVPIANGQRGSAPACAHRQPCPKRNTKLQDSPCCRLVHRSMRGAMAAHRVAAGLRRRRRLLLLLLLLPPMLLALLGAEGTAAATSSKSQHAPPSHSHAMAKFVPVDVKVSDGQTGAQGSMQVFVPSTAGEFQIAHPADLFEHVRGAWDAVVEDNQAGLVDAQQAAKNPALAAAPLSETEAWHHFQAGRHGVIDSARFLVTFGMVPSVQTGGTLLHLAAAQGQVERCRELLASPELNVDVDVEKEDGTTPLLMAATMGHADVVALLLEAGANAEHVGQQGATPLMVAASFGHVGVVQALLSHSGNGGGGGVNVDRAHAYAGTTALHFAAEVGQVEVIRALCKAGASVRAQKSTGGIPLHTAADANQSAAVAVLLSDDCAGGAETANALLMRDTTPMYLAAQRGFAGVVQVLLDHGADPNFVMPHSAWQSRHVASHDAEAAAAWYGAKNTEVGNGATALHAAVENGHPDAVRVLLAGGARQQASMQGASPLVISLQYRHPDIALELLKYNGDDDAAHINTPVPVDGARPIIVATHYAYAEVVAKLLALGADPNAADKSGNTALSLALLSLPSVPGPAATPAAPSSVEALAASPSRVDRLHAIALLLLRAGGQRAGGGGAASPSSPSLLLHKVAHSGRADVLQFLLAQQQDGSTTSVDAPAPDNMTPLHYAAQEAHTEAASVLLAHGAAVDARITSTGATPLMMACRSASARATAMVALLVGRGADVTAKAGRKLYDATPLYLAAQGGSAATIAVLLEAGADPNARLRGIHVTPLFVAAEQGHAAAVRALLDGGADPRLRNSNGLTPLHLAAIGSAAKQQRASLQQQEGIVAVVRQLIAHDPALVAARDEEGLTPLHGAVAEDSAAAVVRCLVDDGAAAIATGVGAGAAAGAATARGAPSVLMSVVQRAARAVREDGARRAGDVLGRSRSLLAYLVRRAAQRGELSVTAAAAQAKAGRADGGAGGDDAADDEAVNVRHDQVVLAAVQLGDVDLVEVLLAGHDAFRRQLNTPSRGLSATLPLHEAVRSGNARMAALLLQHGARVDAANARGDTALQLALDSRDADMIKTLAAHVADSADAAGGADGTATAALSRAAAVEAAATAAAAAEQVAVERLRDALRAGDANADGRLNRREFARVVRGDGTSRGDGEGAGAKGDGGKGFVARMLGVPDRFLQDTTSRELFEDVFRAGAGDAPDAPLDDLLRTVLSRGAAGAGTDRPPAARAEL